MKVAIIADYHISTRWIGDLSIIDQSISLAERLVDYCKSNDIKYLFILGDIVDNAVDKSEVAHAVKSVFNIFSGYFTAVYYILGQHDSSVNMIGDIREVDTPITLFDFPNIYYAHNQIIILDNTRIGMSNFSRNPEYKLPEYVDLYLTHFTISYRFGQKIDNSKFGIMIAGDIHHRVQIDNMYSVGSFQQQSVSKDSEMNNVVIFNCQDKSFEHIDLGGGRLMRHSEIYSGLVDGVFYILKRSPEIKDTVPIVDKFRDDNYTKIIQQVAEYMDEVGLKDMNDEISIQVNDTHSFSTEFDIEYFRVYNFRKLKEFEITFNVGDKILLTGANGSGKSTFLISLFAALSGNLTWSSVVGEFDEYVETEVILNHAGNKYYIRRGSGNQELKCNDEIIPYKNRVDFQNLVFEKLPFLRDLGILFQRPEVGTLFEGINSNTKLSLVSKIYHLEYLDQLAEVGEKTKKHYLGTLNELGYNIRNLKTRIENLNVELIPLEKYKDFDTFSLNFELNRLVELQSKAEEYAEKSKILDKIHADIDANNNIIDKQREILSKLNHEEHKNLLDKYNKLLKSKGELDNYYASMINLENDKSRWSKEIESLNSNKCPRCGGLINADKARVEVEKLTESLVMLDINIKGIQTKIESLSEFKSEFDKIKEYKSQIDTFNATFNSSSNIIETCEMELKKLFEKLETFDLPEKYEFTKEDLDKLLQIKDDLSNIAEYRNRVKDLDEVMLSLRNQETEHDNIQNKIEELSRYVWYVCRSGPIFKGILETLCESWSNDYVKFSIFEGVYRGNEYLDIKISYLKGTNWQDYSASSSGEKSYMDILFIKAVTANAGFLILDEFLRHMDPEVHIKALDEIYNMNTNLLILSSFNPNIRLDRDIKAKYIPENDECKLEIY